MSKKVHFRHHYSQCVPPGLRGAGHIWPPQAGGPRLLAWWAWPSGPLNGLSEPGRVWERSKKKKTHIQGFTDISVAAAKAD